jgi:hypothetical protein
MNKDQFINIQAFLTETDLIDQIELEVREPDKVKT